MMWVNMQPVGTFMVTPPTVYSKVRTGVEPMAVACAADGMVTTSAAAAASALVRRATCVKAEEIPSRCLSHEHPGEPEESPSGSCPLRCFITTSEGGHWRADLQKRSHRAVWRTGVLILRSHSVSFGGSSP